MPPLSVTQPDQGSALVIVLVLMTVLGLALGAIFANVGANLTTSTVIATRNQEVYAADGGIESAIQQLRYDSTICIQPSAPLVVPAVDGLTDTVTCTPTAGGATSVTPWALITTDSGTSSLVNQTSSSAIITGPAYVAGGVQGPLQATSGLYRYCPPLQTSSINPPSGLCTQLLTPDPKPPLPTLTSLTARSPAPAFSLPGCSIFLPGSYTNGITLAPNTDYYFVSGVYYFENSPIELQGDLVGGQPAGAPPESRVTPAGKAPCASDRQAGWDNGSGVEFILGGSSYIEVDSHDMELFSRSPNSNGDGPAGVSIRTVTQGSTTGVVSAPPTGQSLLGMTSGAEVAVHGMVYAPQGSVTVFDSDPNTPVLEGGLDCFDLTIGTGGQVISAQSNPNARYVVLTATASFPGMNHGVTSTAVVEIGNDAPGLAGPGRSVTVQSWLTTKF